MMRSNPSLEKFAFSPAEVVRLKEAARAAGAPVSITGIVFPDEAEYRPQKNGVGWLFLATRRTFLDGKVGDAETRLVRGERAGKADTFSRLPVASALLDKKVVVVGCGAIGGFAGLELARAGVGEVVFIDYETVQPGNSLRWPLGRRAWVVPRHPHSPISLQQTTRGQRPLGLRDE